MAKISYATNPPCCPGMESANDAVKKAMGDKYRALDKYNTEDGPWRIVWMNAYKSYISECSQGGYKKGCKKCLRDPNKYISKDDPHLTPGTLKSYCHPSRVANLTVTVLYQDNRPAPETDVSITGRKVKSKKTSDSGTVAFSALSAGTYRVYAWKDGYSHAVKTVRLSAGASLKVTMRIIRKDGAIFVYVWKEDKKTVVPNVNVIARSRGKKISGITNKHGEVFFKDLPYGSYIVSGSKGPFPTDREKATVGNVIYNVNLTLLFRKPFKIRIAYAFWTEVSEVILIRYVRFTFEIWDVERGIIAEYFCDSKQEGIVTPGLPIGGNETLEAGPWKSFRGPRLLGTKELTGNDLSGPARIRMHTAGVVIGFFGGAFWVKDIQMGKTHDEIPGLSWGHGDAVLEFKGSKASP